MGGFVCTAHRRKNKGFPTLKRTLNWGIEKGRLLKNSRPKGGLIQVICYPTSPETVDITGFFEKFCIAIRTTSEQSPLCSDVLLFLWNKRTSSACFLAPPFQLRPALLGSQLVGRPADGFFVSDGNIGFNRPLQIMIIRTRFQSGMASGFYLGEKQKRRYHECPSLFLYDPFLLSGSLALCPFHFSSFSLSRCQTVCHRASFSFLVFGGLNIHHSTTDEALFKFSTSPAERVAIPFAFAKVAKARQRQSLRLCRCFDVGDMLYPNRTCTQARRRAPTKPVP